ncbi:MAG: tRNA (guanosine(37)-N1)-methyltransferase TrmD [Acidobacteriota bacterium]|jgi:tRNA (guanine37-N1)-methyltransferase
MKVEIISIFPGFFGSLFRFGMIRQAVSKDLLSISLVDLREFTEDRHRTVDDRPYGGGEGMVLKPEPLFRAVEELRRNDLTEGRVILLSPQGRLFDQEKAKELSLNARLILVCGRYEGVDQRVVDHLVDEEISIGDFILSGGELAAAVVLDAVVRLIPGVLGEGQSVLRESFMEGLLDYPQYTRPARFRDWDVPEVLLSGNHSEIRRWREEEAVDLTRQRRPDLLRALRETEK